MRILLLILFCSITTITQATGSLAEALSYTNVEDASLYPTSVTGTELNYGVCSDINDPFEKLNRKIFIFNSALDHFLLKPVAKGYTKFLSENARGRVGNVLDNLQTPLTIVNNTLQLDGKNTLLSFWQFVINSTLGIGGLEDVARKRGLHVEPQTLGNTLGKYGFGPGPYIVLPFFGGSSARDMLDTPIANSAMNPLSYNLHSRYRLTFAGARLVHERAEILPFTDYISQSSPDPYVAIRSSIFQSREKLMRYPSYYRCHHD